MTAHSRGIERVRERIKESNFVDENVNDVVAVVVRRSYRVVQSYVP